MKYEFRVYQMQVDEHLFWIAKSTALKGCVGQGETAQEAISELETNGLSPLRNVIFQSLLPPFKKRILIVVKYPFVFPLLPMKKPVKMPRLSV